MSTNAADPRPVAGSTTAGAPAGWYEDPIQPGQRYWDGQRWTTQLAAVGAYPSSVAAPAPMTQYAPPQPAPIVVTNMMSTAIVMNNSKSAGVAFLLTLFFGPLGMFYSTVVGALLMLTMSILGTFLVGALTLGLGAPLWLAFCWFVSIIWGCIAASGSGGASVTTVTNR